MPKANNAARKAKKKQEKTERFQKMVQEQAERRVRIMLLAAIARKFGEEGDKGTRTVELTEEELMEVPPKETLSVVPLTDDGKGMIVRVSYEQEDKKESEGEKPVENTTED